MTEKTRLDAALVERGLCTGRDRAKGIIMAVLDKSDTASYKTIIAPAGRHELMIVGRVIH